MAYSVSLVHYSNNMSNCFHVKHPGSSSISSAIFSNKAISHLALHKAELFCALHITFEIMSMLAEALSTAAGIYPNPLRLDISDGYKETFATAALCISS